VSRRKVINLDAIIASTKVAYLPGFRRPIPVRPAGSIYEFEK